MQIVLLAVLLLSFNFMSASTKSKSFEILDLKGNSEILQIEYSQVENEFNIRLLDSLGLKVKDSLLIESVSGINLDSIEIVNFIFLRFEYKPRGGSGIKYMKTIFISTRENKIKLSLKVYNYYSHNIDNYYSKDAPEVDEYQEKKLLIENPNSKLEVKLIETFYNNSSANETHDIGYYTLFFDYNECIFYNKKNEDGSFELVLNHDKYLYKNKKWYIKVFPDEYIEF